MEKGLITRGEFIQKISEEGATYQTTLINDEALDSVFIDRLINLISATLGFAGAIFFLKGVLHLTPDLIAKLSQTYWEVNLMQLQNLASQKADIVAGAFLVFFAFLIQLIGLLLVQEPFPIFDGHWFAATIGIAISLLVINRR